MLGRPMSDQDWITLGLKRSRRTLVIVALVLAERPQKKDPDPASSAAAGAKGTAAQPGKAPAVPATKP